MASYQFYLRERDGSIYQKSAQFCADVAAAWRVVGEMARKAGEQVQGNIYVKTDRGEVVILVGVASARVLTGQKERAGAGARAERWTKTA
jgi:hypothetical protein